MAGCSEVEEVDGRKKRVGALSELFFGTGIWLTNGALSNSIAATVDSCEVCQPRSSSSVLTGREAVESTFDGGRPLKGYVGNARGGD